MKLCKCFANLQSPGSQGSRHDYALTVFRSDFFLRLRLEKPQREESFLKGQFEERLIPLEDVANFNRKGEGDERLSYNTGRVPFSSCLEDEVPEECSNV